MEELREATLQYTMCADPTESAARRQRVLQSDASGLMEETAASIIKTARTAQILAAQANAANAANLAMTEEGDDLQMGTITATTTENHTSTYILLPPEREATQSATTQSTRRIGRQARTNPRDLHISPKVYRGSSSRMRNLVRGIASQKQTAKQTSRRATSNVPRTSRASTSRDVATTVPPRPSIVPPSKKQRRDFPRLSPPLP